MSNFFESLFNNINLFDIFVSIIFIYFVVQCFVFSQQLCLTWCFFLTFLSNMSKVRILTKESAEEVEIKLLKQHDYIFLGKQNEGNIRESVKAKRNLGQSWTNLWPAN